MEKSFERANTAALIAVALAAGKTIKVLAPRKAKGSKSHK